MADPVGTCNGLDLLTPQQLDQLFDNKSGYLSKVDESIAQTKTTTKEKTLILDVDNTLMYVRHFMDEMRVDDVVKLGLIPARVTRLTYRLELEFSEGGQMTVYDHYITSANEPIPSRGDWFPDEITQVALIHQADPAGCELQYIGDDDSSEKRTIEVSFLQNSPELDQLEPVTDRPGYLPVLFMYGGYLVRIRPDLAQFLHIVHKLFEIILYTAADGVVYQGLLDKVHEWVIKELDLPENTPPLWKEIYFRSDCDEKFDEYGLPYRHKNLCKLGCGNLSTVVIVDDNPLSYRGFEPNAVRICGFWGLCEPQDKELLHTLLPTLTTISNHCDVRYHLSGLGSPPAETINEKMRRGSSTKYLDHLKGLLMSQSRLFLSQTSLMSSHSSSLSSRVGTSPTSSDHNGHESSSHGPVLQECNSSDSQAKSHDGSFASEAGVLFFELDDMPPHRRPSMQSRMSNQSQLSQISQISQISQYSRDGIMDFTGFSTPIGPPSLGSRRSSSEFSNATDDCQLEIPSVIKENSVHLAEMFHKQHIELADESDDNDEMENEDEMMRPPSMCLSLSCFGFRTSKQKAVTPSKLPKRERVNSEMD